MAKSYYKLYDLKLIALSESEYSLWKNNNNLDNGHLYIVRIDGTSKNKPAFNLYVGETRLDASADELFFKSGPNAGKSISDVIDSLSSGGIGNSGVTVFLKAREKMGKYLELKDVYPIQFNEPKLEICSKNFIDIPNASTLDQLVINLDSDGFVNISGTTSYSDSILTLHKEINNQFDENTNAVKIRAPGKYTISIDDDTDYVAVSGEPNIVAHCRLYRESIMISDTALDTSSGRFELTLDSEELKFDSIMLYLNISGSIGTITTRKFRFQIEYNDAATPYTAYNNNFVGKGIVAYSKNIFDITKLSNEILPQVKSGYTVQFGDSEPITVTTPGTYYIQNIVNDVNTGELFQICDDAGNITYSERYYLPISNNDKYTFSFVEVDANNLATIENVQLSFGHIESTEYEETTKQVTYVNEYGIGDSSIIQWPYCFIALEDETKDCCIYVKWDPALTEDWTEQLEDIDERLSSVENSNTEAIDYIVSQSTTNNVYYEKWNSGIVKYYMSKDETVNNSSNATTLENSITIPTSICKNVLTHNITINDLSNTVNINVVGTGTQITNDSVTLNYKMMSETFSGTFKTSHSIIGFWK